MLELAGGRFDNLEGGVCRSGDVCALIGLKSVVTGDTIMLASDAPKSKKNKKKSPQDFRESVCLAGVASPKPVLTVRLEAESSEQQSKLSEALSLLAIEDPSLVVEETDSATLLSGLGELHIEVTLDRVYREHGIRVMTGPPAVAYRETISAALETPGLLKYDRTIGATRLQASVHVMLEPVKCEIDSDSSCVVVSEPTVKLGQDTRMFLNVDDSATEEELMQYDELVKALIQGCEGALKRGPLGSYPMTNVCCHVVNIDAEGGLPALQVLPGSLRAAAANAVSKTLSTNRDSCTVLEPTMSVEITLPGEMVGTVLSDLSGRRGSVGDVLVGDVEGSQSTASRALVRGEVPLVEILGYAGSLRSLTGGEAAFTAEYRGHSPWECQF
jgi:elongation factor G